MNPKVIELVQSVNDTIHQEIRACNINGEKKNNKFFAPLALLAQQACDQILAQLGLCLLEQIILCGKEVENYGAGNCMLQSFLAVHLLLQKWQQLEDASALTSITLYTTKNHAYLVINDQLVCDPWANFVGNLANSEYSKGKPKIYFKICSNLECYGDKGRPDWHSTEYCKINFKPFTNTLSLSQAEFRF